jgi:23S rRNA pseudouridine1911/1915/1917 synthase
VKHSHRGPRLTGARSFRIVHEDPDLLVIDKDSGILTVPLPGKWSRNLKELLDDYLASQKREALPVHRIDRYTTGLVVYAKKRKAWERLAAQFRARSPERVYLALVRGDMPQEAGTLRHRLELTTDGFRQRIVRRGGTEAVTHYRVLERLPNTTLLEVRLESGLKNQIRVQFRAFGHPLVGDRHYAAEEAAEATLKRQALHAWKLAFIHPATGKPVSFEAPLAPDMERLIERLRKQAFPPPTLARAKASAAEESPRPPAKNTAPKRGKPSARRSAKRASAHRGAKRSPSPRAEATGSALRRRSNQTEARPSTKTRGQPTAKPNPGNRKPSRAKRRRTGS